MSNSKNSFGNTALILIIIVLLLYAVLITYWHLETRLVIIEDKEKIEKLFKENGIDPDEIGYEKDIIAP